MKFINDHGLLFIALLIIVFSSCAKQPDIGQTIRNQIYTQHYLNINHFQEDDERFKKEVEAYNILYQSYIKKENSFLNLLSNEELKARSDVCEALKTGDNAKIIMARRNYLNLLKQNRTPYDLIIWHNLIEQGKKVDQKNAELMLKAEELNKRAKKLQSTSAILLEYANKQDEERKRKEMLSAIKGISSSIDRIQFNLEQERMERFLGIR